MIKQTTDIVKSYVAKNRISPQELTDLIESVHQSLRALASESSVHPTEEPTDTLAVPFMPVDQAVTPDNVYCLICGKACKAIKGHLTKTHHIDIPTYRANYGLPKDFPMVAPSYSEMRRRWAVAAGSAEKLQASRKEKRGT